MTGNKSSDDGFNVGSHRGLLETPIVSPWTALLAAIVVFSRSTPKQERMLFPPMNP